MRGVSIKCDGCGAEKKESNKWWVGVATDFAVSIHAPDSVFATATDLRENEDVINVYDFCGTGCALKWVSRRLDVLNTRLQTCETASLRIVRE